MLTALPENLKKVSATMPSKSYDVDVNGTWYNALAVTIQTAITKRLYHALCMLEPTAHHCPVRRSVKRRDVNYVIHCAAAIRFDMPIQEILRQTFAPTQNLLAQAASAPGMRCFTFMSTAFVNANLPRGTCVQERIYPLLSTTSADGAAIARRLLELPAERADAEARPLP